MRLKLDFIVISGRAVIRVASEKLWDPSIDYFEGESPDEGRHIFLKNLKKVTNLKKSQKISQNKFGHIKNKRFSTSRHIFS